MKKFRKGFVEVEHYARSELEMFVLRAGQLRHQCSKAHSEGLSKEIKSCCRLKPAHHVNSSFNTFEQCTALENNRSVSKAQTPTKPVGVCGSNARERINGKENKVCRRNEADVRDRCKLLIEKLLKQEKSDYDRKKEGGEGGDVGAIEKENQTKNEAVDVYKLSKSYKQEEDLNRDAEQERQENVLIIPTTATSPETNRSMRNQQRKSVHRKLLDGEVQAEKDRNNSVHTQKKPSQLPSSLQLTTSYQSDPETQTESSENSYDSYISSQQKNKFPYTQIPFKLEISSNRKTTKKVFLHEPFSSDENSHEQPSLNKEPLGSHEEQSCYRKSFNKTNTLNELDDPLSHLKAFSVHPQLAVNSILPPHHPQFIQQFYFDNKYDYLRMRLLQIESKQKINKNTNNNTNLYKLTNHIRKKKNRTTMDADYNRELTCKTNYFIESSRECIEFQRFNERMENKFDGSGEYLAFKGASERFSSEEKVGKILAGENLNAEKKSKLKLSPMDENCNYNNSNVDSILDNDRIGDHKAVVEKHTCSEEESCKSFRENGIKVKRKILEKDSEGVVCEKIRSSPISLLNSMKHACLEPSRKPVCEPYNHFVLVKDLQPPTASQTSHILTAADDFTTIENYPNLLTVATVKNVTSIEDVGRVAPVVATEDSMCLERLTKINGEAYGNVYSRRPNKQQSQGEDEMVGNYGSLDNIYGEYERNDDNNNNRKYDKPYSNKVSFSKHGDCMQEGVSVLNDSPLSLLQDVEDASEGNEHMSSGRQDISPNTYDVKVWKNSLRAQRNDVNSAKPFKNLKKDCMNMLPYDKSLCSSVFKKGSVPTPILKHMGRHNLGCCNTLGSVDLGVDRKNHWPMEISKQQTMQQFSNFKRTEKSFVKSEKLNEARKRPTPHMRSSQPFKTLLNRVASPNRARDKKSYIDEDIRMKQILEEQQILIQQQMEKLQQPNQTKEYSPLQRHQCQQPTGKQPKNFILKNIEAVCGKIMHRSNSNRAASCDANDDMFCNDDCKTINCSDHIYNSLPTSPTLDRDYSVQYNDHSNDRFPTNLFQKNHEKTDFKTYDGAVEGAGENIMEAGKVGVYEREMMRTSGDFFTDTQLHPSSYTPAHLNCCEPFEEEAAAGGAQNAFPPSNEEAAFRIKSRLKKVEESKDKQEEIAETEVEGENVKNVYQIKGLIYESVGEETETLYISYESLKRLSSKQD